MSLPKKVIPIQKQEADRISHEQWFIFLNKYHNQTDHRLGQMFLNDFPQFAPCPTLFYELSEAKAKQLIQNHFVEWK